VQFLSQEDTDGWLRNTPLERRERRLFFSPHAGLCFTLTLPAEIYRVSNLVNDLLPYGGDALSCDTLLWFAVWGIWNQVHERAGMYIIQQMRGACGERNPLIKTPGHLFQRSEATALQSFLILPVLFTWDAYLVPQNGEYFVFISHDEVIYVVSRSERIHDRLLESMQSWNPKESQRKA